MCPHSNSSRQKVTAKAKNAVTKKFLKALAVAAELLSTVGSKKVIEELMADNIFDEDNLIQLRTSCIAIARLLRIKASANRDAADGGSAEPVREDCFIFRASSKEVMLLAPGEQFTHALCLQDDPTTHGRPRVKLQPQRLMDCLVVELFKCTSKYGKIKVLGFIRRPEELIMMNAFLKPYFVTELLSSSMLLCYRTNLLDSGMDLLCASS